MIVKELIDLLLKYNPDLRVMVDGYESGYDDLDTNNIKTTHMQLYNTNCWYEGTYSETNESEFGSIPTLVLGR